MVFKHCRNDNLISGCTNPSVHFAFSHFFLYPSLNIFFNLKQFFGFIIDEIFIHSDVTPKYKKELYKFSFLLQISYKILKIIFYI